MMRAFSALLALAALLGSPAAARAQDSAAPMRPRLVVFFTVDQLRADYLERYAAQLTGGLGRLSRGGAWFTNAYQDHAITETAPGHATVLSGRFPRSTGIVMNAAGVQDPQAPLIGGDGGDGASPFRFRGSVLLDWMRRADPRTRGLSVSRKDRGAILPVGRTHQSVYWYSPESGRFTTSTYYADTLPTWLRRFDAQAFVERLAGRSWTPLLPAAAYPEPDTVAVEHGGREQAFPHLLSAKLDSAAAQLSGFPWMDSLTLAVALDGVEAMRLGAGPHPDLLAVSLSTTDAVGHAYGPDSKEIHDQVLRLDRYLGDFLDSLYAHVDSASVIIALTADHGVTPFPEVRERTPAAAAAMYVDVRPVVRAEEARLRARGVPLQAFRLQSGVLSVDREALRAAGVDPDAEVRAFAARLRGVPGVARADLVADLARGDTVRDAVARRWLHMIPPDLPIPLVVTLAPGHIWGHPAYAEHGSPYDDDAHVPILFYGAPFRPGRYAAYTRVVDIAPTLARVLQVRPTEPLDGKVLWAALREPAAARERRAPSR